MLQPTMRGRTRENAYAFSTYPPRKRWVDDAEAYNDSAPHFPLRSRCTHGLGAAEPQVTHVGCNITEPTSYEVGMRKGRSLFGRPASRCRL
jgi:hypothetical protein